MKVNKEALSELLSPKASCRLADCLPASQNLEMPADVGAVAEERVEKHSDPKLRWKRGLKSAEEAQCAEICVHVSVCPRVCTGVECVPPDVHVCV